MTLLPPPGPAPVEPPPVEPRIDVPEVPGAKRRALPFVIAGGALVVLLGGLGAAYAIVAAQRTPDAAASAFLDKLVAGDAAKAQNMLSSIPSGNPALLQPDTFAAATDTIDGYTVLGTSIAGDRSTVTVEFRQGGESYTEQLELERVARDLGVLDVWRVDGDSLPTVRVTYAHPDDMGLDVNGTEVSGFDASSALSAPAWPGTYTFQATGGTEEYGAEPATLTVRFGGIDATTDMELAVTLTEAGIAAATAAVNATLDACLAQPTLSPEPNCGFSASQDGATYTNIRWSLVTRPTVTFGAYATGGWPVAPVSPGSMRLDADYTRGSESGTVESTVNGFEQGGVIVSFTDGAAVFESWLYQ